MFNWQPFLDLINSKDCTHEYNLLNFSDLEKVDKTFFKNTKYQSEKKHILFKQKNFGPNVIYYVFYKSPVSHPAGAFWAEALIKLGLKSTRRGLLGRRNDKIGP